MGSHPLINFNQMEQKVEFMDLQRPETPQLLVQLCKSYFYPIEDGMKTDKLKAVNFHID